MRKFLLALFVFLIVLTTFVIVVRINKNSPPNSSEDLTPSVQPPKTVQVVLPLSGQTEKHSEPVKSTPALLMPTPPASNQPADEYAGYYQAESETFKYFIDEKLFSSPETRDLFVDKLKKLDQQSYDFLEKQLGVKPSVDQIVNVYSLSAEDNISYASKGKITNLSTAPYTKEAINQIQFGNTHELVHIWFSGAAVNAYWFEEGLADFMGQWMIQGKPVLDLVCREKGWQYGYYDGGKFITTSDFVNYSDFSKTPAATSNFYDSQNKSSYYRSAQCFWQYVYQNFGQAALAKVAQRWNELQDKPIKVFLIKDVVNPALDADLTSLAAERYNYAE